MASIVESVRNTVVENFGGAAKLASAKNQFTLEETPDLTGKVAVVTGGAQGIGYGAVHTFLRKNISKVFIISVSEDVIEGAKKDVADGLSPELAERMHWIKCDLADWAAVTGVAKQISESTDRIDILFNNASRGIMTYQLTDYGVDRHMAVNHMGHVVLTSHLLPLLKETAKKEGTTVRIVNQASNAHQGAPSDVKFASLDELNQDLGPNGQYGRAKLANILYSKWLNKHLTAEYPNILVNATHPGFVETKQSVVDIHEPYPILGYGMSVAFSPFKKDQFEGCLSGVYACTTVKTSGDYICVPAIHETPSAQANDEALGEQLMKLTMEIVTDKTRSQSVDKGCPMTAC